MPPKLAEFSFVPPALFQVTVTFWTDSTKPVPLLILMLMVEPETVKVPCESGVHAIGVFVGVDDGVKVAVAVNVGVVVGVLVAVGV